MTQEREALCAQRGEALTVYGAVGPFISCTPYGNGHINDTFLTVAEDGRRYILQRINHAVFPHPEQIMRNISAVTSHIRAAGGRTLEIIPTDTGELFFADSIGSFWRMYAFVEGTVSLDRVERAEEFAACGEAFGRFQGQLADFAAGSLYEAIPNFHHTPVRYANLMRAVERDVCGRATSVEEEIEFARRRAGFAGTLERAHAEGRLPLRVTHNDTKLNNILFDAATGAPACVIDLDTVMPGYAVNDFGDSIRFGANTAAEDETDLAKVSLDLDLYRAYADGFLRGCAGRLTAAEIALLPIGARMMTLECGMRFLTDYLEGDTYFRISRPSHNLDRCRCQFALVKDMEAKAADMQI